MQLPKDAPFTLAQQGRITLQCPQYSLGPDTYVDYPDEYFIDTKMQGRKHRIAVGREEGFTFLSRLGYKYFEQDLKNTFSTQRGCTWQEFADHANEFLDEVETVSRKYLLKLDAIAGVDPTKNNIRKRDHMVEELKKM